MNEMHLCKKIRYFLKYKCHLCPDFNVNVIFRLKSRELHILYNAHRLADLYFKAAKCYSITIALVKRFFSSRI